MTAAPLSDTTVVDLSRLLPGPLAARLLADLGARVIKVEEPRLGDLVREAPPARRGTSSLAAILLSGVESVALDLKRREAREVLERLLERADVLLDTFRPGTLARLGLPPEEIARHHPRLVHCSLTGWGEVGPYASRAGHDLTYQAIAGSLAATEGMAALPPLPVADVVGAWSTVAAILAALHQRSRTGRGVRIDASLYDAAVHGNLTAWAAEAGGERRVGEALPLTGALACYRAYETRDGGWLAVAALEPHFWSRFCDAVGRPDWKRRHLDTSPALRREVAGVVASRTRAEWGELFSELDLPVEPVLSAAEAARHPQAESRGVLAEGGDGLPRLAFPALLDGERPAAGRRFPELGEHTREIVREVGLGDGRRPGVGRRFSVRRLLWRWAVK